VRALPKDLPEVIVTDVSHLNIGDAIHLGDIKAPEGVEIIGDKHISVIACAAPRTEKRKRRKLPKRGRGSRRSRDDQREEGRRRSRPRRESAEKGAAKGAEKGAAKGAEKGAAEKAPEKGAAKGAEKPAEKKK